jgi:hypothetical protein
MCIGMRDRVLAVLLLALPCGLFSADWPQWRGPSADGVSEEKGLPLAWGPELNILWKSPLPGLGTSTPIVWKDLVFLTSQIGEGPRDAKSQDFARLNDFCANGDVPLLRRFIYPQAAASLRNRGTSPF